MENIDRITDAMRLYKPRGRAVSFKSRTAAVPALLAGISLLSWAIVSAQAAARHHGRASYAAYLQTTGGQKIRVLAPSSVAAGTNGSSGIRLEIFGEGLQPGSVVHWNHTTLSSEFVCANLCFASVPASLIAKPDRAYVWLVNNGVATNRMLFTITR